MRYVELAYEMIEGLYKLLGLHVALGREWGFLVSGTWKSRT